MSLLKYAKAKADEIVEILHSDAANGLSTISVESLQKVHGPNKLEEDEKVSRREVRSSVCCRLSSA